MSELHRTVWTPSHHEIEAENLWIRGQIEKIGVSELNNLALEAFLVRRNAYAPYSGYQVGAAALFDSKEIYTGCNSEIVSYSETEHAEGVALSNAISKGEQSRNGLVAIAICHAGDSGPCGRCRQRLAEHTENCLIVTVSTDRQIIRITSLKTIFPYAFTPSHLGK